MQAIISDIHANIEALEVVLADMAEFNVDAVFCLGDVIGYGPNPKECIDYASEFNAVIQGNHEQALLVQMQGASFNVRARSSLDWTRDQFNMLGEDRERNGERWDFLGSLPTSHETADWLLVHGTPRDPVCEYLYPRDIYRPEKLNDIFSRFEHLCFVGHSHVPGVWTEDMVYLTPEEINQRYEIDDRRAVINVGSVGQPRDGDPRASYALVDDGAIIFRKLEYPLETTVAKILSIHELDPFLADRLREGR